jgi:hypothetical protein
LAPGRHHTLTRQFALQGAAVILVLSLAWPYFGWQSAPLPWPHTALAIGGVAFVLASLARQPWPWRIAHALTMPLAWYIYPLTG